MLRLHRASSTRIDVSLTAVRNGSDEIKSRSFRRRRTGACEKSQAARIVCALNSLSRALKRERVGVRGLHTPSPERPSPSPRRRRGSPPSPASKRGRGSLHTLSGGDDATSVGPLELGDVVARQRHSVLTTGDLHLEHHLPHIAESNLAAGEIELPHTAEALVV